MKDKELKIEEVKTPHTLGGASYILNLYINSVKEVENHSEVKLYKLHYTLLSWWIQSETGFGSDNQWTCVSVCVSSIGTGRV